MRRRIAILVLVTITSPAFAVQIIHSPRRVAAQNTAIPIVITLNQINQVTRVTLFARPTRTGSFTAIPMYGAGRRYQAVIPAYMVRRTGVQYYIQAITTKNQTISYPAIAPAANPVAVRIESKQSAPTIRVLFPSPDELVHMRRPVIQVSLLPGAAPVDISTLRVELDGVDISKSVRVRGKFVRYRPPLELSRGSHRVRVTLRDVRGTPAKTLEWEFFVEQDEGGKKKRNGNKQVRLAANTNIPR